VAARKAANPAKLADALGHPFSRPALLKEALTHRSAVSASVVERFGYERLEFLGDRVLGLIIANLLLQHFPSESEGQLARRFNALVQGETLATVAQSLNLGDYLILAPSEAQSGGRTNRGLLADVCEAIIAALFLDGGLPVAEKFVAQHWLPLLIAKTRPRRDAKTQLQEWAQSRGLPLPVYSTISREGPAHHPKFAVRVSVEGAGTAEGRGSSKRAAEQLAAGELMTRLRPEEAPNER
jgi:ribonuclease III